MKTIINKLVYDTTLPKVSKLMVISAALGSLPGIYMCINAQSFDLISTYYCVNKLYNSFSFGMFLLIPLVLFVLGLIPSRLLRIGLSMVNIFQVKLYTFSYALNTYTDVVKTTKYFDILHKYTMEEKMELLRMLNQNILPNITALPETTLMSIALNQSLMVKIKEQHAQLLINYNQTLVPNTTDQAVQLEVNTWLPALKSGLITLINWSPYIIGSIVVIGFGYKVYNFWNTPINLDGYLQASDGIRINQRIESLNSHVVELATQQARLSEAVRATHTHLTTLSNQNTEAGRVMLRLTDTVATQSQLLDLVIRDMSTDSSVLMLTHNAVQELRNTQPHLQTAAAAVPRLNIICQIMIKS